MISDERWHYNLPDGATFSSQSIAPVLIYINAKFRVDVIKYTNGVCDIQSFFKWNILYILVFLEFHLNNLLLVLRCSVAKLFECYYCKIWIKHGFLNNLTKFIHLQKLLIERHCTGKNKSYRILKCKIFNRVLIHITPKVQRSEINNSYRRTV